jgi:hypothetical protein
MCQNLNTCTSSIKVNPLEYFQQSQISTDSAMQPIFNINKIFHNAVPVSEVIYYLTARYKLLMSQYMTMRMKIGGY